MSRAAAALAAAVGFAAAAPAHAECQLDAQFEYVNPTDPDCGQQLQYVEHATGQPNDIPLGYPVPKPVTSKDPGHYFREYDWLNAQHQTLFTDHPDVVDASPVGNTHSGEAIWAYRIGRNGASTVFGQPKGAVMALAGAHAREWQPPEAVTEIFERLVAGRDDGGVMQYLVDNLVVVVLPVLNVDGFRQTQRHFNLTTAREEVPRDGRMRRKNLAQPAGGDVVDDDLTTLEDNMHGVDLNRNHPVGFGAQQHNSSPRSLIYAGSTSHSEPETEAMLQALTLAPAARLRLFMDVHSFSQIYFTPQTGNAERNRLTGELAARMRAVTGNKYRYSPDPVGTDIGTAASYMAATYQIPSWTLETEPLNGAQDYDSRFPSHGHNGFITPDSEIARLRDELARTFVLGFYHQAGPPSLVAAEIRDDAGAVVWSVDWVPGGGGRTLEVRSDGALEAGADYTLWLAFDKPMRWRNGGVVAQYAGQSARLAPDITIEVADGGAVNRVLELSGGQWLNDPGPGPDGYLNYRDDAYAVDFTLPVDLPSTATAAVLTVDADDMAGQKLDGDPATAVDWTQGEWSGLEAGPDCTLGLWVGAVGAAPHSLACDAAAEPPAAEPPPAPSGGGHAGWLSLLVLLVPLRDLRKPRL